MALHNIKIIVVDGGRAGSYKEKNASGGSDTSTQDVKKSKLYKMLHAKQEIQGAVNGGVSSKSVLALQMATQVTTQIVKQSANYFLSDIGRRMGDSNYQQMVNRNLEIGSQITGTLSSVISGAATGSMFGPVGTAIGATAGLVSSGVSLYFNYAEKNRTYQWERFQQDTSQSYNLARANYSATTGRLR